MTMVVFLALMNVLQTGMIVRTVKILLKCTSIYVPWHSVILIYTAVRTRAQHVSSYIIDAKLWHDCKILSVFVFVDVQITLTVPYSSLRNLRSPLEGYLTHPRLRSLQ